MGRFFIVIAFQSLLSVAVFTELLSRCSTRVIILWLILGEAVIIRLIDPSEENVQALSVSVFNHEPVHRHVPAKEPPLLHLAPISWTGQAPDASALTVRHALRKKTMKSTFLLAICRQSGMTLGKKEGKIAHAIPPHLVSLELGFWLILCTMR